ncbi:hypothetical protein K438DRAFT_1748419 [Mycena galopus ATCC 62051]|nr:hypothetical protein K438DRAFT_1748419 [Mycena galopus ATCC 62051]
MPRTYASRTGLLMRCRVSDLIFSNLTVWQFGDGVNGQRSINNTRLRHKSFAHIVHCMKFQDGVKVKVKDFESSASCFNAFAKRIGYREATEDADAFYSPLKAEILFHDYNGTMDINKIFRGHVLLKIYASILRGPQGAKGLFEGKSKLPSANIIQHMHRIDHMTPAAIANSAVLAIWLFSPQLIADGDETKIDYKFLFQTFLRQICLELFRFWDGVLFPNSEHSHGQTTSANQQAVCVEVDAMVAAFEAAERRQHAGLLPRE